MNEQAPNLYNHPRLPVSDDGHGWLCRSFPRDSSEARISIRRRVDRAHGTNCNSVWSVHAASSQLGTVACARLDRVPRGTQLLRFTAESDGSCLVLGPDCLFSLPP